MNNLLLRISSLLALAGITYAQCFPSPLTFSPLPALGPSEVQFTSCSSGADSPRINPINESTFDWWYFDAVSSDGTKGLTVILFTSSLLGFSFNAAAAVEPLNVWVFASFGEGLPVDFPIEATSVTVNTVGDGASGEWEGTGVSFSGAPDLSTYNVTFNNALLGLHGTFSLKSRGPGHYVCGPLEAGVDERIIPHVGWVNVLPAADASVDITVLGQELKFEGNGYHDKNWGDVPFASTLQSWYWGHGTFGDYQIVFFDVIDAAGDEKVGGYVLLDGKVIGSTCTTGLKVRPVGTPYPPTVLDPNPDALTINMTLNDGSILFATVNQTSIQNDVVLYTRWIGTIEGTINGETSTGSAVWEQFKLNVL